MTEAGYRPSGHRGISIRAPEFLRQVEGHGGVHLRVSSNSAVVRLTTADTDFSHLAGNWVVALIKTAAQGAPISLTHGGLQFRDSP